MISEQNYKQFYKIFEPTKDNDLIIQTLNLESLKVKQVDNLPIKIYKINMEQFKNYFKKFPYNKDDSKFILVFNFYKEKINLKQVREKIENINYPFIIVIYTYCEGDYQQDDKYTDMPTERRNYDNLEDIIKNHEDTNNFVVFTQTSFTENIEFFNNSINKEYYAIPVDYIVSTDYLKREIDENQSEFFIILCNEFTPLQFYQLSHILKHTNSVKSILVYHTDDYYIQDSYISLFGWKTFWVDIISNNPMKKLTPKHILNLFHSNNLPYLQTNRNDENNDRNIINEIINDIKNLSNNENKNEDSIINDKKGNFTKNFVIFTQTSFIENAELFKKYQKNVISVGNFVNQESFSEHLKKNNRDFIIIQCKEFIPLQFFKYIDQLKNFDINKVDNIIFIYNTQFLECISILKSFISLFGFETIWFNEKQIDANTIKSNECNYIMKLQEESTNNRNIYINSCSSQNTPQNKDIFENYRKSQMIYLVFSSIFLYKDILEELFESIKQQFNIVDDDYVKPIKNQFIQNTENNLKDIYARLLTIRHELNNKDNKFNNIHICYQNIVQKILFDKSNAWLPSLEITFKIISNNIDKLIKDKNQENYIDPLYLYSKITAFYKENSALCSYLSLIPIVKSSTPTEKPPPIFDDILRPAISQIKDFKGTSSLIFYLDSPKSIITEFSPDCWGKSNQETLNNSLKEFFKKKKANESNQANEFKPIELKYDDETNPQIKQGFNNTQEQLSDSKTTVFDNDVDTQIVCRFVCFAYDLFSDFPQKIKNIGKIITTSLFNNITLDPIILEEYIQGNDYNHYFDKDLIKQICQKYTEGTGGSIDVDSIEEKLEDSWNDHEITNHFPNEINELIGSIKELLGIKDNNENQLSIIPKDLLDQREINACKKLGLINCNFKKIVLSYFTQTFDSEEFLIKDVEQVDYSDIFYAIFSDLSINEQNMHSIISKILYLIVQSVLYEQDDEEFKKYFRSLIKVINPYFSLDKDTELASKYYVFPYIFVHDSIKSLLEIIFPKDKEEEEKRKTLTLDDFDQVVRDFFESTISKYYQGIHAEYIDNNNKLYIKRFKSKERPTFGYLFAFYLSQPPLLKEKDKQKNILLLLQSLRLNSHNKPEIIYTTRLIQIREFMKKLEQLYALHLDLLWIILNNLTINQIQHLSEKEPFTSDLFRLTSDLFNNETYEFLQALDQNNKSAYDSINEYKTQLINTHNYIVSLFNVENKTSINYLDLKYEHFIIESITFKEVFISTVAQRIIINGNQNEEVDIDKLDKISEIFSDVFEFFKNIGKENINLYIIEDNNLLSYTDYDFHNSIRSSFEKEYKLIYEICPDIKEAQENPESTEETKENQVALLLYVCAFRKEKRILTTKRITEVPFVIPIETSNEGEIVYEPKSIVILNNIHKIIKNTTKKSHPLFKQFVKWANPYLPDNKP